MTNRFEGGGDKQEVRSALQDALSDRFDGVDWERLHARILADAARPAALGAQPWDVVASWASRGIPAAGALLAAAVVALLILPLNARSDAAAAAALLPVAEELMASVPEETRLLLHAGSDLESLLNLVLADEPPEDEPS